LNLPKLAICNFLSDVSILKRFALAKGFASVDWTLRPEDLPGNPFDESRLLRKVAQLAPLEVRYHLAFQAIDLGDADIGKAQGAMEIFRGACELISRLDGRYMTMHLGRGLIPRRAFPGKPPRKPSPTW
jgi:hypothetical protein